MKKINFHVIFQFFWFFQFWRVFHSKNGPQMPKKWPGAEKRLPKVYSPPRDGVFRSRGGEYKKGRNQKKVENLWIFHFSEFSKGNSEKKCHFFLFFLRGTQKKSSKKGLKNWESRGGEHKKGPLRSSAWPGIFSKMSRESGLIRTTFRRVFGMILVFF